jgi:cytochrome c oxidase subunit 4
MNTPVVPSKIYIRVWVALLALLLLTWGLAELNLGPFNVVAALTIALLKTVLVILFFMHVRYSPRLTWLFVAAGFVFLLIMVDLTLSDYLTRGASGRQLQPRAATPFAPPPPSIPPPLSR